MARLWQAQMIAGSSPLNEMGQYLSLLPEFFMALPFDITNNHAVYTWLQAGFFLWTVLEFARCFFCGWKRWLVWILLMTCPLIIGYSVFWEMSVVCLACILWLLILEEELDRRQCSMSRPAKIVFWCVYAGLVFVMTGYRLNAGTVAVGLLGLGAWKTLRRGYPKEQLICRAVAVIAAVLSAFFLPAMLGVQGHNNAGFGIVWEIRCTLAEIGEGNGVDTYLDDLLGEGRTREILAEESDQLLSGYGFTMGEVMSAVANKNEDIYRKYFGIILKYPVDCKMKLHNK